MVLQTITNLNDSKINSSKNSHLSYGNKKNKDYSITCTNISNPPKDFYLFQTFDGQKSKTASLVWEASSEKMARNTKILFEWDKTYSFVWQGYGLVQPGFVKKQSGKLSIEIDNNNAIFGIKNSAPLLTLSKRSASSDISITVTEDIPSSKFAVGIGMDEYATFIEQAYPERKHQFEKKSRYWLACRNDITQGMVLSESNKDPKIEIIFGKNNFHQNFEFNGENFIKKY